MSMDARDGPWLVAPLECRVGTGVDAEGLASAVVQVWQDIDEVLAPVLGSRGVLALYKRSLWLAGSAHPWLEAPHEAVGERLDHSELKLALAQREPSTAAAGAGDLFKAFRTVLAGLIGITLTERLLFAVWNNTLRGSRAQDPPP
jgi:hypothetical protein